MLKRAAARSKVAGGVATAASPAAPTTSSSSSSIFHATDPRGGGGVGRAPPPPADEVIERVRLRVPNAHVFKLPPKPSAGGWRGADWCDKVWQGTLKVVERGDETAVLLVDPDEERNTFAVCPIKHDSGVNGTNAGNGVDRCVDSSRYFVLRIQNAAGRHMYIGLAFNERNDAFDFNTSLEDSRREKEMEQRAEMSREMERLGVDDAGGEGGGGEGGANYKMKEGEKIRVSIPRMPAGEGDDDDDDEDDDGRRQQQPQKASSVNKGRGGPPSKKSSGGVGGFLKPSSKDTPSRLA